MELKEFDEFEEYVEYLTETVSDLYRLENRYQTMLGEPFFSGVEEYELRGKVKDKVEDCIELHKLILPSYMELKQECLAKANEAMALSDYDSSNGYMKVLDKANNYMQYVISQNIPGMIADYNDLFGLDQGDDKNE